MKVSGFPCLRNSHQTRTFLPFTGKMFFKGDDFRRSTLEANTEMHADLMQVGLAALGALTGEF